MSGTTSKIEMEWLKEDTTHTGEEEEEGKAITYKNRFSDFVPSSYLRRIESFLKKKQKKSKANGYFVLIYFLYYFSQDQKDLLFFVLFWAFSLGVLSYFIL